ncbi:MAG: hypothetical protein ACOYN6_16505 [Ignavibacteria bacterium]
MKAFLKLLVVLFFISSDAFPQNFIERNVCKTYYDDLTHKDFIMNKSSLTVNKFDSVRFCATVTNIYESLNLDILTDSESGLCLMGISKEKPMEYVVSISVNESFVYLDIMNISEVHMVFSKEGFKRIRKFQVELAEKLMKEVRKYL